MPNTKINKNNPVLEAKLNSLPANAGIYQFKDKNGKIIYVGKAKNLRNRVRQYFTSRNAGPRIERMVSLIKDLEIINTDSEVESLILEMNLIKELKPRYNVNLKDDKTYPYIVVTNEPFPRVFPTRKRRSDGSKYFGPYTDVGTMKYSLKMLRDIFMIRTCSFHITQESIEQKKFKLCLEYHIHKCEGPCEGLVTQEKYNEMIDEAEKVLNGKTSTLIKELRSKMDASAAEQHFEEAARMRNKINSLEVYSERQKIVYEDMLDRDVFSFVKEEDEGCAMVLNIRDGKVIGKRHFYLDTIEDKTDSEILESVLFKYYSENNFIPDEIDLQSEIADKEAMREWFSKKSNKRVDIVFPKRGEKLKLLALVKTNAQYMLDELKLQRLKREFIPNSISSLKRDLRLTKLPRKIECFDISNIQGTDTVASMVVFHDGKPRKSEYRKFKIQTASNEVGRPDDFASMREVIYRRYIKSVEQAKSSDNKDNSKPKPLPDLIVVDGGKGQLSSAVKVLNDIGIKNQNIIGLAKKLEEVYVPDSSDPQSIPKTSSGLKLLQRIRDEAHRFAVTFHRSLRDKRTLTSELETITGIGKKTAGKLLTDFGSVEKIKEQVMNHYEEFEKKAGKKTAERLKVWLTGLPVDDSTG
ncbi:MAG: excinuclease ABC subunit UvrC [Ignavibacteria bacterium]|jgi:excinuclease ABC subunit C